MPFLTTSTVSSADDLVGLLHPTTDHGVRLVACRKATLPPLPDSSHRRCTLRSLPLLTRWTPSPRHCWPVHRMSGPSRGWPSSVLQRRPKPVPLFKSRPHLRGFPARSPLLASRVATTGPPVAPLGFSPTLGSHPRPRWRHETAEAVRTLFESRPKPGPSRPRTRRSEPTRPTRPSPPNLLAAASTACAIVTMTQGLEAVHAVSHVPLDAEASRWRHSLPKHTVADAPRDCRDALLVSIGAPAEADRNACAPRRRVSPPRFPEATTSHVV
jgi:hypothetical protein